MERTVGVQANASAPRDAIISGAVEHRRAHHPELGILGALAVRVKGRLQALVVRVGGRLDEGGRDAAALLFACGLSLSSCNNSIRAKVNTLEAGRVRVGVDTI